MMKTDFHLVVDSDMKQIFQVAADGISYSKLNIPGLNVPVQTEYDPDTGRVSACFDKVVLSLFRIMWLFTHFSSI